MGSARRASVTGTLLLVFVCVSVSAQQLRVTLLGTGSPIPMIDRFGPSTLVEAGNEKLLIDCGRGSSLRLWQLHIPLGSVTAVFLTHLHSDHVVGIPDLWLTGWLPPPFGRRTDSFRIWGPIGTQELMANLEKAFQADIRFRTADGIPSQGLAVVAKDIAQGLVYEKNGVKVTAFEVDHATVKPAFGYRINYGGRSVVLSGDTRLNENLIRFSKGADVLVHEVAWARPELLNKSEAARIIIALHTTPEEAGTVFSRVKPKLAVYSHIVLVTTDPAISEPTSTDVITLTRKTYSGPLEWGEDLMTIEIGSKIDVHRSMRNAQQ
ncbi:MAG: MBL fold metallo-hydrolase [Acidobacteriaceae bacterium]|nr:MBL fold metallo-hydrolase [Acidobacteriaceae bacterium]MBV9033982.1 MBL fold metallo-hydrolase [Acidobacteriaceae bacterium]MBV9225699.1 MBL fold metallo-hydrolase [Acidobacteriaceae bacterium]